MSNRNLLLYVLTSGANSLLFVSLQFLDGWVIFAEYARPREPYRPQNNMPPSPYGNRY